MSLNGFETEDLGACIGCDMAFTDYDTPSFEVRATWRIRVDGRWVPQTADGFVHEDCIDYGMTIIERIDE